MIDRFSGTQGERLRAEALQQQVIVQGNKDLSIQLSSVAEVLSCKAGHNLIRQGDTDNDIYFILSGQFSIQVNGREVARRAARQHVGEMALIDPKARRSASVVALEECVVAKVPESKFAALAARSPDLWRNLARELGDRLRQRNDLIRQRNEVPRMFVGSSVEALPIANEIQAGLSHDSVVVTVWTNRIFGVSEFSLEGLERAAEESDFAALVLSPDDKVVSREKEMEAPRDNVVFELGLFMGAIGRKRTFLVLPQGANVKIPTDLLGITPLQYRQGDQKDLTSRIGPVCNELRKVIKERGTR